MMGETAIYGISSIVGRLVNWVVLTPYLTRVFVSAEYGVITELFSYIAFLLVIFTYRMETAFFRFAGKKDEVHSADTVFTTASIAVMGVTVLLTAILLLSADPIAVWLKYPGKAHYVRLFVSIIALDALAAIPFARLRLDNRPFVFMFVKLAAIGLNIVLLFLFLEGCPWLLANGQEWVAAIYHPHDRIAYIFWANVLASGATLLWLLPLYRGVVWRFAYDLWQRMLKYALPLVLAGLAGIVNLLIGTPLLKYWGGGDIAANLSMGGIYGAAAKLAVLMNLFVQAFNYAAEPFFFRQAGASTDRAIFADTGRAFALAGSLAFLGIMLYLEVIQYFLGKEYREGVGILPILLISNFS
ncbi:MAG: hypothetical protein R2795_12585 [Saprospiraceae bacterium]